MYQLTDDQLLSVARAHYSLGEWDRQFGDYPSGAVTRWLGEEVVVERYYEYWPDLEGANEHREFDEQIQNGGSYLRIRYYTLRSGHRAVGMGEGSSLNSADETLFMLLSDYEYLPADVKR